jgi:hypothetical protein
MFKTLLMVSALFTSTVVLAQVKGDYPQGPSKGAVSIEEDSYRLASEIAQNGRYLTLDQRSSIAAQLEAIRATLYGQGPVQSNQYTCVAKDNDNRAPWVFGLRSGINVTRINNAVFNTVNECQDSLNSIRFLGPLAATCVAKDSDGRNPWVFGILDGRGTLSMIGRTVTNSQQECKSLLARVQVQRDFATFCTSRDSDGRSPFVAASIDLRSSQVTFGSESFNDINSCWNFLGAY